MEYKRCSRCKLNKPKTEFNKRRAATDGLRPECKSCQNAESKKRYHEKGGQKRHSERYAINRSDRLQYCKNYYQAKKPKREYDPAKQPARVAVYRAIKNGKLVRPMECQQCGEKCKPDGHHHNGYDKAHYLDVVWLCRKCHTFTEHPEFLEIMEAI